MFEGVEFVFVKIFEDFTLISIIGLDFGGNSIGLFGKGLFGFFKRIIEHVSDGYGEHNKNEGQVHWK